MSAESPWRRRDILAFDVENDALWKKEDDPDREGSHVQGWEWERVWHIQENVNSSVWLGHRRWDMEWWERRADNETGVNYEKIIMFC